MVKFADYQLGQLRKIAFQYNEQLRIKDVSKISKNDLVKALEERLELNEDGTKIRVKAIDISNPEVAELSTAVVKEVLKQRLPDVLNYKNGETEEGFLTPMPTNPKRSYKTRMYFSDGNLQGKIIYYFEKQENGSWDEVDEEYIFKTLERLLIHSKFPSGVVVRELSIEEGYGLYQVEVKAELENKAYFIDIILNAFSKTVMDNNLPTIRVNIVDFVSKQVLMKTLMSSAEKWTVLDLKKGLPQPNTLSVEEMRDELQAPPPKEKAPPKPKKATAPASAPAPTPELQLEIGKKIANYYDEQMKKRINDTLNFLYKDKYAIKDAKESGDLSAKELKNPKLVEEWIKENYGKNVGEQEIEKVWDDVNFETYEQIKYLEKKKNKNIDDLVEEFKDYQRQLYSIFFKEKDNELEGKGKVSSSTYILLAKQKEVKDKIKELYDEQKAKPTKKQPLTLEIQSAGEAVDEISLMLKPLYESEREEFLKKRDTFKATEIDLSNQLNKLKITTEADIRKKEQTAQTKDIADTLKKKAELLAKKSKKK
jgi:hypothetical protein